MYTKDLVFKSRAGLLTFESLQLDKRLGKVLYYNKLQFLSIQKWLSTYILIDKKNCEIILHNVNIFRGIDLVVLKVHLT